MTEQANSQPRSERQFAVQRIYVKDISFETPNSPDIFRVDWKPENNLNLNTGGKQIGADLYEVTLTLTLTVKVGDKTAYLIEVQQAGIFTVLGFPEQEKGLMLGAYAPNLLFPYAREVITDLVNKGSFPQMVLQPMNFEALYMQRQKQLAEQAKTRAQATH